MSTSDSRNTELGHRTPRSERVTGDATPMGTIWVLCVSQLDRKWAHGIQLATWCGAEALQVIPCTVWSLITLITLCPVYLFIALAVIGHSRCPHVMVIISLRPEESRFHLAATWLDQAALAAVSVCFCIACLTVSCIPLGGSCLELSDLCPCQGPGYIGDTGIVPTFRKQKAPEACPCAPAETQQIQEILEAIRTSHVFTIKWYKICLGEMSICHWCQAIPIWPVWDTGFYLLENAQSGY